MKIIFKWLNLIPLVMFIAMDVFLEPKIYPIRMVAVATLVVLNVVINKSMKEYLISSLILVVSCVIGTIIRCYYYYYFIDANPEAPIFGAAIVFVYALFSMMLCSIGAVAVKNKR